MNDLISRQVAVEALKKHRELYCDNTPDTFSKLSYAEKSRVSELDMAIATLVNSPSAEPEIIRCKECKHSEQWYRKCRCFLWSETGIGVFEDGFCNYAERRSDG